MKHFVIDNVVLVIPAKAGIQPKFAGFWDKATIVLPPSQQSICFICNSKSNNYHFTKEIVNRK